MRAALVAGLCLALAACATPRPAKRNTGTTVPLGEAAYDHAPDPSEVPPDLAFIPDAVPRAEAPSRSGNKPEYEVLGETYRVLGSAEGFREKGRASYYAKRFHGRKTANGEKYDMYAMTAAHKTLPLPSYVRVIHVKSGRSVIVRVNDRGPFYPGRIIDLSYAAATKLGILAAGHAEVEIEAVVPHEAPPGDGGYLQVAAFDDPISAVVLREELDAKGLGDVEIWATEREGSSLNRVVIGPFPNPEAARGARESLLLEGVETGWVRQ